MKSRIKVCLVLLFVTTLIIISSLFGNALLLYIAPKVLLSSAVSSAFSQLENRFQNSPVPIFVNILDPDGRYTINAELCTFQDLLGEVGYDMTIQADSSSHQFSAEGTISAASMPLDISLYADTEFMAISCPNLVPENYYGITYDTFSSDVRQIPLLNFIISDSVLQKWNNSILKIREMVDRDFTINALPVLNAADIQDLMLKVLSLPPKVEKQSVLPNGTTQDCHRISYHIRGELLNEYIGGYSLEQYQEIVISFFMHDRSLVFVEVACTGTHTSILGIYLGHDPKNEDIHIQLESSALQPLELITCKVSIQSTENSYAESWTFNKTSSKKTEEYIFNYSWNPRTGRMTVYTSDEEEPINFSLSEEEGSVTIASEQFPQLIKALRTNTPEGFTDTLTGHITVTKGSRIITPAYKNLNQWSLEDFLKLLEGIGSIIGIDLGV